MMYTQFLIITYRQYKNKVGKMWCIDLAVNKGNNQSAERLKTNVEDDIIESQVKSDPVDDHEQNLLTYSEIKD